MIQRLFSEHPNSVGETYFAHLVTALGFFLRLALAALVCLVHAVLPFLFVKTGSAMILNLHDRMAVNRRRDVSGPRVASDPEASAQRG